MAQRARTAGGNRPVNITATPGIRPSSRGDALKNQERHRKIVGQYMLGKTIGNDLIYYYLILLSFIRYFCH